MLILRPTAKLSHFCAHMFFQTHSQLVSLQDVFPSGCAVFKVLSGLFRSLKTIQVQEEEQSTAKLFVWSFSHSRISAYRPEMKRSDFSSRFLPRKEVIQPHLPIRLPCYDFTPVTGFGRSQLPWCDGRCVQGPGTYSPRHADPRLLATPTSCGRVAAHNLN